ncbi:MAG: HD domain-containing protein [Tannerellaceae bacterium]|jgi:GTP pyrophosphokinase|nr:HD domain-containing protein [Tannerellaceae bacterium]
MSSVNIDYPEEKVQGMFYDLIKKHLNSTRRHDVEMITKAFNLAKPLHDKYSSSRKNGDPYILHPLAVAHIVCSEMNLGATSICCALMHDLVEDTPIKLSDIKREFGETIAEIVDGLTKIADGKEPPADLENFLHQFRSTQKDFRVILIKIADRLHNMRTLDGMPENRQRVIANQTMHIYVPIAQKVGFFSIKSELEDLSFQYINNDEYLEIAYQLKKSEASCNKLFDRFAEQLKKRLDELGIKYTMKARMKSIYSIWNKMNSKKIPFEEIYDIYAVRIIFEPVQNRTEKSICLDIYSKITDFCEINQNRTRDWVSFPKPNGYQAFHLTVMGPEGKWIEIQIRSRSMDEIAEKGIAAHDKYKGDITNENPELDSFLRSVLEILKSPKDILETLSDVKSILKGENDKIAIFTPKGERKYLPSGATALDFAYELHTNIGNSTIAAKVNGILVPLSYKLNSYDRVEIITSNSQQPKQEWLQYISTAKAKKYINQALTRINKKAIYKGQLKVFDALEKAGLKTDCPQIDKLALYFSFINREDFYRSVEEGHISLDGKALKKIINGREYKTWENFIRKTFKIRTKGSLKENLQADILTRTIEIKGSDKLGLLAEMLKTISADFKVNIFRLNIEVTDGIFICTTQLDMHDIDESKKIFDALSKIEGVLSVRRVED